MGVAEETDLESSTDLSGQPPSQSSFVQALIYFSVVCSEVLVECVAGLVPLSVSPSSKVVTPSNLIYLVTCLLIYCA